MSGFIDGPVATATTIVVNTEAGRVSIAEYVAPLIVFGLITAVEGYVRAAAYPLVASTGRACSADGLAFGSNNSTSVTPRSTPMSR